MKESRTQTPSQDGVRRPSEGQSVAQSASVKVLWAGHEQIPFNTQQVMNGTSQVCAIPISIELFY